MTKYKIHIQIDRMNYEIEDKLSACGKIDMPKRHL